MKAQVCKAIYMKILSVVLLAGGGASKTAKDYKLEKLKISQMLVN